MRYIFLVLLLASVSCEAKSTWKKHPKHREFKTGLKMREGWKQLVKFHNPLALNPKLLFPDNVDLRKGPAGYPAIKDQGPCGDCYIFGAVATLEGTYYREDKRPINLSEQQVLSCNGKYGCDGGYFDIMDYFKKPGVGSCPDYKATVTACPTPLPSPAIAVREWLFVGGSDQESPTNEQLQYVLQFKPLVVSVYVDDNFMQYAGGVFNDCTNGPPNHMVSLVGYGRDGDGLFFILRNSWGISWGEGGYMRIRGRCNSLASAAAFVNLD